MYNSRLPLVRAMVLNIIFLSFSSFVPSVEPIATRLTQTITVSAKDLQLQYFGSYCREKAQYVWAKRKRTEGGLSHHHGTREPLNPRVPVNLLAPKTQCCRPLHRASRSSAFASSPCRTHLVGAVSWGQAPCPLKSHCRPGRDVLWMPPIRRRFRGPNVKLML